MHYRQIEAIGLSQGADAAAVSEEQAPQGRASTTEAALQVRVIQHRMDLQIDSSGSQSGLELRQTHAMTGGLSTVKGEA